MRLFDLFEAELDPSGWGETPMGGNVAYEGLRVRMKPSMFLWLAHDLDPSSVNPEVAKHMAGGGKIAHPFLQVAIPPEWEDGNFSKHAKVVGHEGRNRMTNWIKMKGDEPIEVQIFPRGGMRRHHITDDMIKHMASGMFNEDGDFTRGPLFDASSALEESKSYTIDDFSTNVFESFREYRRWFSGPKKSDRGATHFWPDGYSNSFISDRLIESTQLPDEFQAHRQESIEFSNAFKELDNRNKVKIEVGKSISVLSTIATPDENGGTIELSGFLKPKKITNIHLDNNGKIDHLVFEDGSTFPEAAEFTNIGGVNITNTIFFPDYNTASSAYTKIWFHISNMEGNGWEVDNLMVNEDTSLEEGWKDWVAAGAMGAAALGAQAKGPAMWTEPNPAHAKAKQVQQVKQVAPKQTQTLKAQPQQSQAPIEMNLLSNNINAEAILHKTAVRSGIRGVELAQFMAQTKHESADFSRMKEIGGKNYFHNRYDPKAAPKTAKILGNTHAGDGVRYHGRGFIQITGRDNYRMAGEALGLPLEAQPELASKPEVAAKIAVWYWKTRVKPNISNFADTAAVTKYINPALRGLEDRKSNFVDYKRII